MEAKESHEEKPVEKSENPDERPVSIVRFLYGFELCYILLHIGWFIGGAIVQNQMLKQECMVAGYGTICDDLSSSNFTQEIEREIQPKVLAVRSTAIIINSFFPPFYTLFLGSWSDTYGRKTIMMMSFIGYSSTMACYTIFTYISEYYTPLTSWVILISELPMTLLGGWPLLDVAACCYVTDISERTKHAFRLGMIGVLNYSMSFACNMSSSFIYEATNASILFTISLLFCISGLILLIIIVDESIPPPEDNRTITRIKNIISMKGSKEILQTLFKPREQKRRRILWFSLTIIVLTVFTMHGSTTVGYLFGREQFKWGLREFTIYDATNIALTAFGILACLALFRKVLKISDPKLGLIAILSGIAEGVFKAFATETYQMYLGSVIGLFRVFTVFLYLSILSSIFDKQEIGKIFSATIALEALSAMGAGPLYSIVYNFTIDWMAGAFYFLTAISFGLAFVLASFVIYWMKHVEIKRKNSIASHS